jgi:GcrA cell cycle regulator
MPDASWSVERVELLRKLWAEGETAAVIGARLGGMSRAAVLGKVFRLRLRAADAAGALSAKPKSQAGVGAEEAIAPARRRRGQPRIKPAPPSPAVTTQHKTLFELTNVTCRWPHGRPGTGKFFFCGAPEADLQRGIPYCALHMQRAYGASAGVERRRGLETTFWAR